LATLPKVSFPFYLTFSCKNKVLLAQDVAFELQLYASLRLKNERLTKLKASKLHFISILHVIRFLPDYFSSTGF
jgi:hypothetical protein